MKNLRKRCLAAGLGLCFLCLYGCEFPDLFSGPEATTEEDFFLQASSVQASTAEGASETEGTIFVYVVGEVQKPGVYELKRGDRLEAAITAAGGFTEEAEVTCVNLARPVSDGEQILVLSREAYATAGALLGSSASNATGLVNINTADERELTSLPGIGQTRARAVIDHRNKHGLFEKIEDIMQVNGIKQAAFEQIRDLITTGR